MDSLINDRVAGTLGVRRTGFKVGLGRICIDTMLCCVPSRWFLVANNEAQGLKVLTFLSEAWRAAAKRNRSASARGLQANFALFLASNQLLSAMHHMTSRVRCRSSRMHRNIFLIPPRVNVSPPPTWKKFICCLEHMDCTVRILADGVLALTQDTLFVPLYVVNGGLISIGWVAAKR